MSRADPGGTRLLRRFALLSLLVAGVLAILFTALHALAETAVQRHEAAARLEAALARHLPGLGAAVDREDDGTLTGIVQALAADPAVSYASLTTSAGARFSAGLRTPQASLQREYHHSGREGRVRKTDATLMVEAAPPTYLDVLATLEPVRIGAVFAMLAPLVVIAVLVTRHLVTGPVLGVLDHVAQTRLNLGAPIRIRRGLARRGDEIDDIITALNKDRRAIFDVQLAASDHLVTMSRLQGRLSETDQDQAAFTYAVSHDLKTPSNTLTMLLKQLRAGAADKVDEHDLEILEDLNDAAARLSRLIRAVIGYAVALSHRVTISEVDLNTEVAAVLEELRPAVAAVGGEVRLGDLPRVKGDAEQMRMLFAGLISNGLKFHAKTRPPLIEVGGARSQIEGWVEIHVRDNGIGIAPEFHTKIFEFFTRLNHHGAYEGSGVGLTMCHRIATDHGGRIEVESTEDLGSVFTVFLPCLEDSPGVPAPAVITRGRRALRLGMHTPAGHLWNKSGEAFAEELAMASGGDLTCQVASSIRMSSADDILAQIRTGALDLAYVPAYNLSNLSPDFGALVTPFLAEDALHASRILRSGTVDELRRSLEKEVGFVGVGVGMGAMRQFLTTVRLEHRQDFAGLKLGILPHVPIADFFAALGAQTAPMAMHEAAETLTNGQFCAIDTTFEMIWLHRLHNRAHSVMHSNHMMYPLFGGVSLPLWRSLGADERKLINQLLSKHVETTLDTYRTADQVFWDRIAETNCVVTRLDRRGFGPALNEWKAMWFKRAGSLRAILDVAEQTR